MVKGHRVIRLRGHHLLCLQGFRGQGYSPEFVANMAQLLARLRSLPNRTVRVIEGGDDICEACPNWESGACLRYSNADLTRQDGEVLAALELRTNQSAGWDDLLSAIAQTVEPARLKDLCGYCPWLSKGCCQEGLAGLRAVSRGD